MNRIFSLVLLLFVLSACYKSSTDKAHDLIETYCNDNFFSPEDYKPISFEDLKVYVKPYEQSHQYIALDEKRHWLEGLRDTLYASMYKGSKKDAYDLRIDSIEKAVGMINLDINSGKQSFKPVQEGWTIVHTYNKKDESGKVVEGRSVFLLDVGLTKVLQVTDQQ